MHAHAAPSLVGFVASGLGLLMSTRCLTLGDCLPPCCVDRLAAASCHTGGESNPEVMRRIGCCETANRAFLCLLFCAFAHTDMCALPPASFINCGLSDFCCTPWCLSCGYLDHAQHTCMAGGNVCFQLSGGLSAQHAVAQRMPFCWSAGGDGGMSASCCQRLLAKTVPVTLC